MNDLYCLDSMPKFLGIFDPTIAPPLLFYTYIPVIFFSLLIGTYVLYKDKFSLASKLLFFTALFFTAWVVNIFFAWIAVYVKHVMFSWTITPVFELALFISAIYLFYVFIDEERRDISVKKKMIFLLLSLPIILILPTKHNITYFDSTICEGVPSMAWYYYLYGMEILSVLWVLFIGMAKYIKFDKSSPHRKEILYFTIGISLFLGLFVGSNLIGQITLIQTISFIGSLGMLLFLGFLAYLIVKFKAFNIKLLGAQALVIGLVGLVAAEFFFTPLENTINIILISVTVLLSTIFGIVLINSVRKEAKRKEELQMMSDKLAQANDQLRKLDNAKSEFISIASHQLRTPLTAVKGFVSLLLEGSYGKITAKQEDVLNKVYTSNDRLINLVEDLLNISRIESGRMEFKLAPTKIEDLCQEVADTLMMKAKGRKLYLDYQLPKAALPELMIDGTKVREVISNMVDNAVKYTEKGGVTVRAELSRISNDKFPISNKNEGDFIRVIVSDTGIGIPKEELPYLFSKFSRGKDTARLNTGGTGLGLYVGKAMIESNGGKIWAESEGAGRGSRFIIELPVKQNEELLKRWGNAS